MRILLVIVASVAVLWTQGQALPQNAVLGLGYTPWQAPPLTAGSGNYLKSDSWQLRPSFDVYAGYIFYNRGISYVSAPLALTLYHPITRNVTAFGGVYAAPSIFTINDLRAAPVNGQFSANPFNQSYNLALNAGIQGGLMYTNDAHTFSISGSVSVQRGTTPVYYAPQRVNNGKR